MNATKLAIHFFFFAYLCSIDMSCHDYTIENAIKSKKQTIVFKDIKQKP